MSSIDGREKVEEDKVDENDESTYEEANENQIYNNIYIFFFKIKNTPECTHVQ